MLAISVPIHDMLMNKLEDIQSSVKTSSEMKNAVEYGLKKIKAYYRKTDDCPMYAIATSKLLLIINILNFNNYYLECIDFLD
jgi:hypothetical protein